ncbi:DeoR family transcriptional regulator [Enterococcus florum]|uniref:DeoR family transcriptional regulator n=1 Tax=Enterococcus florum TaxID=2480627 RepID=A0A4P5P489_9ENTE|nr:DeoR/GlpR family DNA-binding transcription regulator [Enterococcus florum]GCF92615.1 DeoR family transcriptional regulator [Enterococcus florum]
MLTEERRAKILNQIEEKQFISVNQLSEIFNVHETTIRRDLDELEAQGAVSRIHGGVVPVSVKRDEPDFEDRATENINEKVRIGKYAATLISDGECVILDSGTTTLQIAKALNENNNYQALTVITNDVNIASVLRTNRKITTIVTGGTLFHDSFMLNGQITNETLEKLNVDKVFIATPALNIEKGLTHFNELLVPAKTHMIKAAKTRIVVTDHTKIGHRALYTFLPITEIDLLVSDKDLEAATKEIMLENGVKQITLV